MFSTFVNGNFNEVKVIIRIVWKHNLIELIVILIFADLNISKFAWEILVRHPKYSIIFISIKFDLLFYLISPERWIVTPVSIPLIFTPWVSEFN